MFEIKEKDGKKYLKYIENYSSNNKVRGRWVEIGKSLDKSINYVIEYNRKLGYQVEIDEHDTYRVLVLKD